MPSALGLFSMLAVSIEGRGLTQLALWLFVTCFVLAVAIELVAVPLALWRLISNPILRTRLNAVCVTVAGVFLLSVVIEIGV